MSPKWLERLKKGSKNKSDRKARWEMAQRITGHHIRYITEKRGEVDEVIGRDGSLNIKGEEFLVATPAEIVLRCRIDDMQAWELLSRDGVVITAPDLEHGGIVRTIIVFFVYYRR